MEAARDVPSEASRPVRSDPGRGRPLPVPAGFDGQCSGRVHSLTRSHSDQLGCGRPLCARPAPGPLFLLFAQVVRQVCWALSMLARSVHHVHAAFALCRLPAGSFRLLIAR